MKKNTWAYSIVMRNGQNIHHVVGVVPAANEDEAIGKAFRIGLKLFPFNKGWIGHNVVVTNTSNILDVDQAYLGLGQ